VSFSCDVSVLLYASDASSPVHERARGFLKQAAAGGDLFCPSRPPRRSATSRPSWRSHYTRDGDFRKFPFVEVRDPFAA
jgi:hypothetical protein